MSWYQDAGANNTYVIIFRSTLLAFVHCMRFLRLYNPRYHFNRLKRDGKGKIN